MEKSRKQLPKISIKTPEDMFMLGKQIARKAFPGMVLALNGSLGAGKTTLTKGIAKGLNINEEITSPSFTIIKEYLNGKFPLYHIDLYRIDDEEELILLGFNDYVNGDGLTVIEWSEKAKNQIPIDAVNLDINIEPDFSRLIKITGIEL